MRKVFTDTMLEVGKVDSKLAVVVGDISHFALKPFAEACPGRFFNIGILEPTIVSLAAGLAHSGLYPVAHTIAPFLIERSLEQIKLDFCYQNLAGTLVSVGSAFDYSGLGCSHHCYNDIGAVKGLPNTEVIYPASDIEFKALFQQTYRNDKLTYFRLPGVKHGHQFDQSQIALGKGIVVQEGNRLTIVATGPQLRTALDGAALLKQEGIEAEVLYYPTIKPFDVDTVVTSASKTKNILVIEEHSKYGGIGEDVLKACCNIQGMRYSFIQIPDVFQRGYGEYKDHLERLGMTKENVVIQAKRLCNLV